MFEQVAFVLDARIPRIRGTKKRGNMKLIGRKCVLKRKSNEGNIAGICYLEGG